MEYILLGISFFLLGALFAPFIIFGLARRSEKLDDSNMNNIIRLFSHVATHAYDFLEMKKDNGSNPFEYFK